MGTLAPKALKAATATIPIVFTTVGDPIGAGLVQSLAHPGGNLTGLSGQSTEFKSKQLELLLGYDPRAARRRRAAKSRIRRTARFLSSSSKRPRSSGASNSN